MSFRHPVVVVQMTTSVNIRHRFSCYSTHVYSLLYVDSAVALDQRLPRGSELALHGYTFRMHSGRYLYSGRI